MWGLFKIKPNSFHLPKRNSLRQNRIKMQTSPQTIKRTQTPNPLNYEKGKNTTKKRKKSITVCASFMAYCMFAFDSFCNIVKYSAIPCQRWGFNIIMLRLRRHTVFRSLHSSLSVGLVLKCYNPKCFRGNMLR